MEKFAGENPILYIARSVETSELCVESYLRDQLLSMRSRWFDYTVPAVVSIAFDEIIHLESAGTVHRIRIVLAIATILAIAPVRPTTLLLLSC